MEKHSANSTNGITTHLYDLRGFSSFVRTSNAIMTEYADRADEVACGVASGDNRDAPWYAENIGKKLGKSARKLLENYSKIPADEFEDQILKIVSFAQISCITEPPPGGQWATQADKTRSNQKQMSKSVWK